MADGASLPSLGPRPLVDGFGRTITYLRVSVTDRCDFRCSYCLSDPVTFVAKSEVLRLEELERLCRAFVELGVRRLRLTGGEPLIRPGFMGLARALGAMIGPAGLTELTLTTNAVRLREMAVELAECGIRRVNISLDTLDAERFRALTRHGSLERVLAGIEAARAAGLSIKINCVALRGFNEDEFDRLIGWCGERGFDLTLIEVMPLGDADGQLRAAQFLSLAEVRQRLDRRWTLEPLPDRTGGPARYHLIGETGCRLGLVTPISGSFCESCNRLRLTATGRLHLCLGQEHAVELRESLRAVPPDNSSELYNLLRQAVADKPEGHHFAPGSCPAAGLPVRPMSATGG